MPEPQSCRRPVFVVGSGRSGTTLVLNLLVGHPELAWISRITDRVPSMPFLAALSRPAWATRVRGIRPSVEVIRALAHCGATTAQLRKKGQPLGAHDMSPQTAECLRSLVAAHCSAMGRSRFVSKSTANTMRMLYLVSAFPDAQFIHVVRSAYAVCNSLLRVNWWPDLELWWSDSTPREWEGHGGDPHELAAQHWCRQVTAALDARPALAAESYMEVRYEELVRDPRSAVNDILRFLDLDWNDRYELQFQRIDVDPGHADAWRKSFDRSQLNAINDVASSLLSSLGYDIA